MNLRELEGVGYIPTYTRITITDDLHNVFNFRTDNEITILKDINKIFKNIKNKYNHAHFINVVKACSTGFFKSVKLEVLSSYSNIFT